MKGVKIIEHKKGAPLFRLMGLGPSFFCLKSISQLKKLFDENTFWANNRSKKDIKRMLANSSCVVSAWKEDVLIGFGRATSDKVFRAVIWDVIVAKEMQKCGLGRLLVDTLLKSKSLATAEKVYVMTTNCKDFYINCGFEPLVNQSCQVINNING
tara:strand:+ start:648 stop:1112 length:465 start_codon:yes stop_codon:yes gene_type:complete